MRVFCRGRLVTVFVASAFASAGAQKPDVAPRVTPESVTALNAALNRDLAPFNAARARLVATLRADSGTGRADSVFMRYQSATERSLRKLPPSARRALRLIQYWDTAQVLEPLRDTFLSNGIRLDPGEGDVEPTVSDSVARTAVGRFLTPRMRAWLDLLVADQLQPMGDDGEIVITLEELGRRLDATDRIRAMGLRFAASDALDREHKAYLGALLAGTDNTPAFSHPDSVMVPAFRTSLEQFRAAHPTTESGRLVAQYLRLLNAAGWRKTPPIDSVLHAASRF